MLWGHIWTKLTQTYFYETKTGKFCRRSYQKMGTTKFSGLPLFCLTAIACLVSNKSCFGIIRNNSIKLHPQFFKITMPSSS